MKDQILYREIDIKNFFQKAMVGYKGIVPIMNKYKIEITKKSIQYWIIQVYSKLNNEYILSNEYLIRTAKLAQNKVIKLKRKL